MSGHSFPKAAKIIFALLVSTCLFTSCHQIRRWLGNEQERLAQIGGQVLFVQDVKSLLQSGISSHDSANIVNHYIDTWAIDHLLLRKAEEVLSKEEKNVEQELDDYRRSLLVFRYQTKYLKEHLDTIVSPEDIQAYYNQNKEQFVLSEPLCKVNLIKMGLQSPNLAIAKALFRSNTIEDKAQLDHICESSAEVYTNYDDAWVSATELAQDLPLDRSAIRNELIPGGYISVQDSLYAYLVVLNDLVPAGSPAPIEYKEGNIEQIVLSKRKQELLLNLEAEVLKEGRDKQQIKIYNKDEK